jgi:hypothetical protein
VTVPTVSPLTSPAVVNAAEPLPPEIATPKGFVTFAAVTVSGAGVTVLPEATVWIVTGVASVEATVNVWLS